jgi:TolB protein
MTRTWMAWLLAMVLVVPLAAQGNQEVVLTASAGSRLAVALPPPVTQLDESLVLREFSKVLQKDLEEAGPFALLPDKGVRGTDAASYKAWLEAGTDWLLVTRLARTGEDVRVEASVIDVRAGKQVFSKPYVGRENVLRRIAHTLSDDLVGVLTGERGVASSRVVFYRDHGNAIKEIWQVDGDGSNPIQLTHHKSLTMSPSVAADGKLAYVTYKGGTPEIWGQKAPGGPHVRLAPAGSQFTGHCYSPSWSPDGKRLAFAQVTDRGGNVDIMCLDVESGKVRRLTYTNCSNTDPSWNPAGTQIAFTSNRDGSVQIFLMEEDGSNMRRLTREGSYNTCPAWSPSGAMIAYISRFENKFDLFVYKLGDGKSSQVTLGVSNSESPSWSPDERRLVFSSGSRGGMRLFTTDLSGNSVRPLTEFTGCQNPKWTRSR